MSITTEQIAQAINNKTKPRGSLGRLEDVAAQICRVQDTIAPSLVKPTIAVFAADHGLAAEPVSAYPQEVTIQMAYNILAGGAGISVFCRQNGIDTVCVDAGVAWDGAKPEGMVDHWMGPGTASSLTGDAMTAEQVEQCYAAGAAVVDQSTDPTCTIMGFGELGIGNTSASSLIAAALTGISLEDCVGPGSGLAGDGLNRKLQLLQQVWENHPRTQEPRRVMAMYGGFEIAQMTGAMRRAYELGRIIMIDGFVATAAFLAAWAEDPSIIDNAIFCHESGEPGHHRVLEHLGVTALLNLGMRLGEGTGCAVAYPVIVAATTFLNDMADFEQAGVSTGEPEAAAA